MDFVDWLLKDEEESGIVLEPAKKSIKSYRFKDLKIEEVTIEKLR